MLWSILVIVGRNLSRFGGHRGVVDQNRPDKAANNSLKQKRIEAERMRDVLLLLEDLFRAQESTIKLIFDRLYDVGSVHLIDQKLSSRLLNRLTRAIAPGAKPVFRIVGYLWFRNKCPKLIANWLYKKVASGQSLPTLIQELEEAELIALTQVSSPPLPPVLQPARQQSDLVVVAQSSQEIRKLRSQVQFLLGALAGTVMLLGSTTLWLMRDSTPLLLRPINPATACLGEGGCREAPVEAKSALE